MGGDSKQKTTQKQKTQEQTQAQTTTTAAQNTASSSSGETGPYKPTQKPLNQIIKAASSIPGATNTTPTSTQTGAIQGLLDNAQLGIDYVNPAQTSLIQDLYSGGNAGRGDQYVTAAGDTLKNYLQPGYLDPNTNPYLAPSLQALQDKVRNSVSDQFALAGRDFSGNFSNALGKGYAQNLAPLLMGQYNTNVGAQQSAAGLMPGISNALDASALNSINNRMAAFGQVGALNQPYTAQLAAEEARAQLPYTNIGPAANFLTPLAQLGGTSSSNSTGTSNTNATSNSNSNTTGSLLGTGTQTQSQPIGQTLAGAAFGGLGLLGGTGAFGTTGWLAPALKSAFS